MGGKNTAKKISKERRDKMRFDAYKTPGVFEVEPYGKVKQVRHKRLGLLQRLKNWFKEKKKKGDEYERGRERVKEIINK